MFKISKIKKWFDYNFGGWDLDDTIGAICISFLILGIWKFIELIIWFATWIAKNI